MKGFVVNVGQSCALSVICSLCFVMSANDFIMGRLVEIFGVMGGHWVRHNFVDNFFVVHGSCHNFVVRLSKLIVVFDGVVVGSLGIDSVHSRDSKRVSDVVSDNSGLVMGHKRLMVVRNCVVKVLVSVRVVCSSSVFAVISWHVRLLNMSIKVMRRLMVVDSVLGGVQSVRHGQLRHFSDFPGERLFVSDRVVHGGVILRVRLVAVPVRVGVVRLVLGHLVRDGHTHVRLVFPLEVLHLGRVTVVRVELVRAEIGVAVLLIMRCSILVLLVIVIVVHIFSFVERVGALVVVSISSCGVISVGVPVVLVVGVVDGHVCGHIPRAENVGGVVVAVEMVRRVVGSLVVASPVIVTVRFRSVLQAGHRVLALRRLHMSVDVPMVSRVGISVVSISSISGMLESMDACVGV